MNQRSESAEALPTAAMTGPCSLGDRCKAPAAELAPGNVCRVCSRQLHPPAFGCSLAVDPDNLVLGLLCKDQPCTTDGGAARKHDPVAPMVRAMTAGLPDFLVPTQRGGRIKEPGVQKQRRQSYSKEMKELLVKKLMEPNANINELAKQYNIPFGTLRSWKDLAESKSGNQKQGTKRKAVTTEEKEEEDRSSSSKRNVKSRKRYSNDTKVQVLLALQTRPGATVAQISEEFGIPAGTIRGFRNEADSIHRFASDHRRSGAKANPSRDPLQRIWNAILDLIEKNSRLPKSEQLSMNVSVVKTIGAQARETMLEAHAEKPFLSETELMAFEKFKASDTWARKWAKDHGVLARNESRANDDVAAGNTSRLGYSQLARAHELQEVIVNYNPHQVYTVSSVGLYYKVMPHEKYIEETGATFPQRAAPCLKRRDYLTLYVCCNEAGRLKAPLACIGGHCQPACLRAKSQLAIPYFAQKEALSTTGTLQQWWREVFLPHVRNSHHLQNEKVLLLVENDSAVDADLLRDPTNQIRVEILPVEMPPSQGSLGSSNPRSYNPVSFGIAHALRRRYRLSLLREIMQAFPERNERSLVAAKADVPESSWSLREGRAPNIIDALRILRESWNSASDRLIRSCWQQTRLRPLGQASISLTRPHEDKKLGIREKKVILKEVNTFVKEHSIGEISDRGRTSLTSIALQISRVFSPVDSAGPVSKEAMDILEQWLDVENLSSIQDLHVQELKRAMNIEYLCGLERNPEPVLPGIDDNDGDEQKGQRACTEIPTAEFDRKAALDLATAIKATASKVFQHGEVLGDLAVQLDEASTKVFDALRSCEEQKRKEARMVAAKAAARRGRQRKRSEALQQQAHPVDDVGIEATSGETQGSRSKYTQAV